MPRLCSIRWSGCCRSTMTDASSGVGRRDPVIGRLQEAAPGLRPMLFYSPYEAAAWAILSARRPQRQMAEVRQRLSEDTGADSSWPVGGDELTKQLYGLDAPPSPEEFEAMAEPWRPFRAWATVLTRAAGPRLLGPG
jgi:3-methyladenine DNA glycosylase/8-oxoguanine DNA glycosylase